MANSKDDDKKAKIPYEPPRLFDLGGGVAYAKGEAECNVGGSPAGDCKTGSMAISGKCENGGIAGKKDCKDGGMPDKKCSAGSSK